MNHSCNEYNINNTTIDFLGYSSTIIFTILLIYTLGHSTAKRFVLVFKYNVQLADVYIWDL